jgi:hypothetical protein
MATVGSVIGGFVTYRLARKGGKETLERKFPAGTLQKVYKIFARWGFAGIAIVAVLPPPVPMVAFVFAAGAMQYSVKKFLVALTLGRFVRYCLLAFLAARYGRQVLAVVLRLGHPVLIAMVGVAAAALGLSAMPHAAGQQAVEGGAPAIIRADALRHLALDEVLRARVPARRWSALATKLSVVATTRGATLLATAGDGRLIVFDRKNGVLQAFDTQGVGAAGTPLADVTALASDPYGRVFAATREQIVRWDATGLVVVASLASFGSPSAIAVDAAGSVWIADRKGDRIGRWRPGSGEPNVVRESKGSAVSALVAVGSGVIAAEQKTGRLVAVSESGSERAFGAAAFRRPTALAVDAAGRISVLDDKAGTVTRLAPDGGVQDTLALEVGGVSRPLALASAPGGALRILDGSSGMVAVAP